MTGVLRELTPARRGATAPERADPRAQAGRCGQTSISTLDSRAAEPHAARGAPVYPARAAGGSRPDLRICRRSRLGAGRERRGEEGQQGEAGLTLVSHPQFLIAPVEGKRPGSEGNRAIVGIERPFAFDREDHEVRRTVGVRGKGLARAEPDETDVGLRALKERLSHHSVAVVGRSLAEADDVHHRSIARCELGQDRWSGNAA